MAIWTSEIKELEKLYEFLKGQLPDLEKELERLVRVDDANMVLLYSRRCLEVIITDLCECELKRPRKTEPLKGIIDKLHKEEKVPSNIITSMDHLNSLSAFGAHPKDFDPEQVKPVLVYLDIIIKWYLKYKDFQFNGKLKSREEKHESKQSVISPPERSIIVLPFENISPDPDQEYFTDGLTEEIITDLSHIKDLLVISRSSAKTFKGTKKTIPEIAQAVRVRYVLEGSVRKAGNNLRITVQLIDSMTDAHLWAEKYTGTIEDVFDIQETVSKSIANTLKIKLSSREKDKIHERPIDNVFAYDCYKRAYYEILSMSPERLERGLKLLQKGLEISGKNALIYTGIAFAYWQYVNLGFEHELNIKKAEEFAQKALAINQDLAEAHHVIGLITVFKGRLVKAIHHLVYAHKNKPEDTEIMGWLALGYSTIGKIDAEKSLIDRCYKIDPINSWNDTVTGYSYFFSGRFGMALDQAFASSNLTPESGMNQFFRSLALLYNNRAEEAYDFISKNVAEPGIDMWTQLTIFLKYVLKKDKEKLSSLLIPDFVKSIQIDPQNLYHMATFYSYLGEKEKSLEYLENAVGRGFINYPLLSKHDILLNNIRDEERFKKLMEQVKYEWENFEV
jgi:TolB-like protein/tetratricopeptide (TPR) repeat protein